MSNKGQRTVALTLAGVFLLSSIGYSVAIIYQITNQDKIESALQDQSNKAINDALNNQQGATKLEGTQLDNFTPIEKVGELQKIDIIEGTGNVAKEDSVIVAHYTGALAKTGVIFQSSHDGANQPFTSPLSNLIPGWKVGIPGMKTGSKRRLIIPAELAYGASSPSPNIPPNSDLVFDIELIAIQ